MCHALRALILGAAVSPWVTPASSATLDDVTLEYAAMRLDEAIVGGRTVGPEFYRHQFDVSFGRGPARFGLSYQYATKDPDTVEGVEEVGVMLNAGYDFHLRAGLRLDTFGRVGVTDTDPSQPLYAADTDVRANLVWYSPNGAGLLRDRPVHPSTYVGSIVNEYGRVQAIAGAGLWWNRIGVYGTGLHSFNGVEDPMNPGDDFDKRFAYLKNSGVSASVSYDWGPVTLLARKHWPIENGGNDLVFGIRYHGLLDQETLR